MVFSTEPLIYAVMGQRKDIKMNSRERIKKAMSFEKPDRVPLMCQFSIGFMLRQLKVSPAEFWFDGSVYLDGLIELRNIFKFDGILVTLFGHKTDWRNEVTKITRNENGETVYWKNGDKTICPDNDLPVHFPAEIKTKPDISNFDPDSLSEEICYIVVSQGLDYKISSPERFAVLNKAYDKTGGQFSIHGEIGSPFDYFLDLIGHQDSLMALIDEPDKCKEIIQKYTNALVKLSSEMSGQNIDAIKISSPFAGAGFISKEFYSEFVLPYESQIIKAIKSKNKHVYIHTCGSIGDRLELIADSGVSGIECLDPPPIGNVDLADAKKRIGSRCFIKGNIDSVNILLNKSVSEVKKDAKERIEIGKIGSGFILSTACSIAPEVPKENIIALYEAVEEWGWY
jgi:MtaA/CmuA family methyltransferase